MFHEHIRQAKKAEIFESEAAGQKPPVCQPGTMSETMQLPDNANANPKANAASAASLLAHWSESGSEKEAVTQGKDKDEDRDKDKAKDEDKAKITGYPKVIDIHGEKVNVASVEEEKEAQQLITTIKDEYGIEVSSLAGIEAIKAQYDQVPATVTSQLAAKQWELKELRAVCRALAHYAPILGKKRTQSNRKGAEQEVVSVSKVDQAIDDNTSTGQRDTSTLGEYFKGKKNFGMFSAGTNLMGAPSIGVFKDNETNLEANATHELAHGLLLYKLEDFIKESGGYWVSTYVKSNAAAAEAPITQYGQKSAKEDLSETAKYFFIEPKTLETKCPKRYAFIKTVVDSWQPKDEKRDGAAGEKK